MRLFVNAMTADGKNYLLNRENLMQPIQMQLYQKQKTFPQFFFAKKIFRIFFSFLKSILTFKHFSKKDDTHS